MKLLSLTLLVAAALAAVAQGDAGYPETGGGVDAATNLRLRRFLADGSSTGPTAAPPTTAPPTTAPPTAAPPTTAPPTAAPPTTAPPTSAPPVSPTPAPGTPTPDTPTPTPGSGSGTIPTPTTRAPTSNGNDTPIETVSPNTKVPLSTSGSSGSGGNGTKSTKTPAPGSGSSGTSSNTESDSALSTGAIAGIVGGIVAGVAILAFVTMTLIRRKRENEDDPLSPFELSMDKGYAGAQGYGGSAAAAGTNGAQRNAPGHTQELGLTDTPPAGAVAAGVAYSQFYDQTTSPGSLNHTRQASAEHEPVVAAAADNSTNLWLSAMEAQNENDSYLSAKEPRDNDSLNSGGRNSYDVGYGDDQSSQISGSSDLNSAKDFPDYDDESARGSYEL